MQASRQLQRLARTLQTIGVVYYRDDPWTGVYLCRPRPYTLKPGRFADWLKSL